MKPVIGICPLIDAKKDSYWMLPEYMKAVEMAGGIPVMLSATTDAEIIKQYALRFDGFLFTGGDDISPACYGEEAIPECGTPIVSRDTMELTLYKEVLEINKPILGICRGHQMLNVALGGTLYQDINSQYPIKMSHRMKPPYNQVVHNVSVLPDTPFADMIPSKEFGVNSRHHQAIKDLAPGLQAGILSEDGLIEGAYLPNHKFVLSVQWHPEHALDAEMYSLHLFQAFIDACSTNE